MKNINNNVILKRWKEIEDEINKEKLKEVNQNIDDLFINIPKQRRIKEEINRLLS